MQHNAPNQTLSSRTANSFTPEPLSWTSHPAFVGQQVATVLSPSLLSEERKMLKKERIKQQNRGRKENNTTTVVTEQRFQETHTERQEVDSSRFSDVNSTVCASTCPEVAEVPVSVGGGVVTALTSTPVHCKPVMAQASAGRVSHKTVLDHLAHLHTRMITGNMHWLAVNHSNSLPQFSRLGTQGPALVLLCIVMFVLLL